MGYVPFEGDLVRVRLWDDMKMNLEQTMMVI